jgi:hypothetical protein
MQEHTPRIGFILKVIEHSYIGPRQESVPKCSMTHRELLKWHCLFTWFACARTDLSQDMMLCTWSGTSERQAPVAPGHAVM